MTSNVLLMHCTRVLSNTSYYEDENSKQKMWKKGVKKTKWSLLILIACKMVPVRKKFYRIAKHDCE